MRWCRRGAAAAARVWVDLWLRHVQDVQGKHAAMLERLPADLRHDRLCELNVLEQVLSLYPLS